MLIATRGEQAARISEKRQAILAWLKGESFSTVQILAQVIGTQGNAAWKTLRAMQRDNLVEPHTLANEFGTLTVWAITPHGSAMAVDPEDESPDFSHFEAGRLAASTIAHSLDVQRVRLKLTGDGWTNWRTDRQCRQLGLAKVPDGVGTNPDGTRVAIEVERTFKTQKRYEAILANYLELIGAGRLHQVLYLTPVAGMAPRLERLFHSIRAVRINGERQPIDKRHLAAFRFEQM